MIPRLSGDCEGREPIRRNNSVKYWSLSDCVRFAVSCIRRRIVFGAKCPTDDAVIAWFHASKRALDDLLNMVAADDEKVTHVDHGTVEVRPGTALPETRKEEYLSKLRETGAASFIYQRNEGSTVTLGTDAISPIESISKVCRYMDIRYIENISKWHQAERLRPTLDGLETNGLEGFWLRHIEEKWYIR